MAVAGGMLRLQTRGHGDIVDLTEGVARVVATSGIERGLVTVFAIGATVGVTTMEYEPGALRISSGYWTGSSRPRATTSTTGSTTTPTPMPTCEPRSSGRRRRSPLSTGG